MSYYTIGIKVMVLYLGRDLVCKTRSFYRVLSYRVGNIKTVYCFILNSLAGKDIGLSKPQRQVTAAE